MKCGRRYPAFEACGQQSGCLAKMVSGRIEERSTLPGVSSGAIAGLGWNRRVERPVGAAPKPHRALGICCSSGNDPPKIALASMGSCPASSAAKIAVGKIRSPWTGAGHPRLVQQSAQIADSLSSSFNHPPKKANRSTQSGSGCEAHGLNRLLFQQL